jgi:hypothetical protein
MIFIDRTLTDKTYRSLILNMPSFVHSVAEHGHVGPKVADRLPGVVMPLTILIMIWVCVLHCVWLRNHDLKVSKQAYL